MGDAVSQGVDIQLRVLQTLLGLVTGFSEVHGELLGDVRLFLLSPPTLFLFYLNRLCYYVSNSKNPA
jgi:hypothetical protein